MSKLTVSGAAFLAEAVYKHVMYLYDKCWRVIGTIMPLFVRWKLKISFLLFKSIVLRANPVHYGRGLNMCNTFKVIIYLYPPVCNGFYVSVYTVDSKTLVTKKWQYTFTEELGMLTFYCPLGNSEKTVKISEDASWHNIVSRPFCLN